MELLGEHRWAVHEFDEEGLLRRVTAAARRAQPDVTVHGLRRLEGGVSSLTYASALRRGSEDLPIVLKVAPPGLSPVRNRDVLRQARILRHLTPLGGFPVPAVVFEDDGAPPLFAMELRPGDAYEPLLDVSASPPDASTAAARMRQAVRALARLHAASPESLGVGDEPVTELAEELDRWMRLFATIDADLAPGHEKLCGRLAAEVPIDGPPVLVHGDYRLANMLFVGADLEAVIDWEIWSVGDPRPDLAWLLMHVRPAHVFHENRSIADLAAGAALPTQLELLDEYATARREYGATEQEIAKVTEDLPWFLGLCYYKTASTTAAIIKRDRKNARTEPKLVVAARHLGKVLDAGLRSLDGWS